MRKAKAQERKEKKRTINERKLARKKRQKEKNYEKKMKLRKGNRYDLRGSGGRKLTAILTIAFFEVASECLMFCFNDLRPIPRALPLVLNA